MTRNGPCAPPQLLFEAGPTTLGPRAEGGQPGPRSCHHSGRHTGAWTRSGDSRSRKSGPAAVGASLGVWQGLPPPQEGDLSSAVAAAFQHIPWGRVAGVGGGTPPLTPGVQLAEPCAGVWPGQGWTQLGVPRWGHDASARPAPCPTLLQCGSGTPNPGRSSRTKARVGQAGTCSGTCTSGEKGLLGPAVSSYVPISVSPCVPMAFSLKCVPGNLCHAMFPQLSTFIPRLSL